MAIAATGAVSMSDLRTEFVGGSAAISFSDLYRGGSNIRANAANNSSTNLAASVPTSGAINYTDFRSTAKGFRKTYTATATNQNASSVFGDDYSVNYPKEIVINSGVELGATGTGEEALQIDSGLSGTMTITNNGTLSGAGGSANGGAGGDAFEANVACTLINNGTIRAGGGGGGQGGSGGGGGNGGQGRTSSTSWGSWSGYSGFYDYNTIWLVDNGNSRLRLRWSGTFVLTQNGGDYQTATQKTVGNAQYQRGSLWESPGSYYIRRRLQTTSYTYYNGGSGGGGGAGGAGGRGQGYNHGKQNGSSGSGGSGGSAGGTNAGSGGTGGTGGTGGNGGTYGNGGGNGASGATGNSGGNGNYSNGSGGSGGSGGSSGGAAGKYIRGLSNVTFTNNGTVQGGTA